MRATLAVLAEHGYAGLTMDAVAHRAQVGKAAIYRRYQTKQEMVFSALVHGDRLPTPPDAGSLLADLTALARKIVDSIAASAGSGAIFGLLADMERSTDIAARFRTSLVASELSLIAELLDRAVQRGEITASPDPRLVHSLLTGPAFTAVYVHGTVPETLAETLGAIATAAVLEPDAAAGGKKRR